MTYAAFPSFASSTTTSSTTTSFEGLAQIRAGERFVLRGYEYEARGDASVVRDTVWIQAVRRHLGMPSGWELADVMESRR